MIVATLIDAAPSSTTAGIITATSTLIIAITGVIAALTVFLPVLRASKRIETQVGAVHTIVNQQNTDHERYEITLVQLLTKHGIEIPVNQAKPVPGVPDAAPGQPLA